MKTKLTLAINLKFTKFGLIETSVNDVIEFIRNGDMPLVKPNGASSSLKEITEAIRNEIDPCKQNEWKEKLLPIVFFNGIWDGGKICEYSNITALDFDHIKTDEQYLQTMVKLKNCPFISAVFRTFKPRRIKALVMHNNTDPSIHKEMYEQLIELFKDCGIDSSCKDISRKTFLVWDNDIWVNPNCIPYDFSPKYNVFPTMPTIKTTKQKQGKTKSPQSIINILNFSWRTNHSEYWLPGYRATSIFKCACQFCDYGVPQDMAEDYFLNGEWIANDFTEEEVLKHVRGAYNHNRDSFGSKDFT